jgi:hyperosmotically inducible protein
MGAFKGLVIATFLSASFAFAVTQMNGPAEKAGKKIDTANKKAVEYMDDSAITAEIKAEILKDPLLKSYSINVTTNKGVVDLTGIVESQQSIDRALEIVNSNKKVSSVINNLFIKKNQ